MEDQVGERTSVAREAPAASRVDVGQVRITFLNWYVGSFRVMLSKVTVIETD